MCLNKSLALFFLTLFTITGCSSLSTLTDKVNLSGASEEELIFEFDLNAIPSSQMAKTNHLFVGYYTFVSDKKSEVEEHFEDIQKLAITNNAFKAIWLEQNTVLSLDSKQTICDFSKESDIHSVLMGEKLCENITSQKVVEDRFRQIFSLWREVPADNKQNVKNQSLLAALEQQDVEAVVAAIEAGAQPEIAFDEIIGLHDEVLMEGLLKRTGITYGFKTAVESGYLPTVETFLEAGVKPVPSDVSRALAVSNMKIARLLIAQGAGFPDLDFLEASCWGDSRMVLRYLTIGGDPNQLINNNTAMLCAHRYGQLSVMKLYERKGFELDDNQHKNDIWVLRFGEQILPVSLHADDFCSKVYRRFELNKRQLDPDSVSPVLYCSTKDNITSLAKIALEKDANANFTPVYTYPLHFASYHGNYELAQELITRGARIDAKDIGNNTPLHNAAIAGFLNVAKLLGDAGADPNATNSYGDTPLDAARKLKNRDVQIWLTRYKSQYQKDQLASKVSVKTP